MTDNELKVLVASIAESQKETNAQIKATNEQTQASLASLAESQKKTELQVQKTELQVQKTSAKVDKVSNMYGGMANNQGAATEEFYYNSLSKKPILQGIRFDKVSRNVVGDLDGIKDEYDIVMVNGQAVYIIEVKHRVHIKDVEKLVNKKVKNFMKLFTEYAGYQHHIGLACFYIDEAIKKQALAQGVNILQRKGDVIESIAA